MDISNEKIKQIGMSQRMICLWILAVISIYILSLLLFSPLFFLSYIGPFIIIYSVWRMSRAWGSGIFLSIINCILVFIPLVGLLTLLIMNRKATKILRNAGLHVGLLGVSKKELDNLN